MNLRFLSNPTILRVRPRSECCFIQYGYYLLQMKITLQKRVAISKALREALSTGLKRYLWHTQFVA